MVKSKLLTIPASKFTSKSFYSFILRHSLVDKTIELYFHPQAETQKDLLDWLEKNDFKKDNDNSQVYSAKSTKNREALTNNIFKKCEKTGAYKIDDNIDPESLPDKNKETSVTQQQNFLATTIAKQVASLIDQHMVKIEEKIEEKITKQNENLEQEKETSREYEKKITELQDKLKNKDTELAEYRNLLGVDNVAQKSPLVNPSTDSSSDSSELPLPVSFSPLMLEREEIERIEHLLSPLEEGDDPKASESLYDELNNQSLPKKQNAIDLDNLDLEDSEVDIDPKIRNHKKQQKLNDSILENAVVSNLENEPAFFNVPDKKSL